MYEGPIRSGRFGNLTTSPYKVLRCTECGLERLDPTPSNVEAYESGSYREAVDGSAGAAAYYAIHDIELARRLALVGSTALRGKVVMDVGCGPGSFLDVMKGLAARTIGIEPQEDFGRTATVSGHEHYSYPGELASKAPATVDVAFSFQVIEHVADPLSFLTDVARCLKPGGRLHLTTPNRDDVLMAVGPAEYKRFFYRLVHSWYFDTKSLARAAELAGLRVISISTPHHYDLSNFAVWLRDRRPGGLGSIPELAGVADEAFRAQVASIGRGDALYAVLEA